MSTPLALPHPLDPGAAAALTTILEHVGVSIPAGGYPTIAETIPQWRLSLAGRSEMTNTSYRTAMNNFCRFLAEQGIDIQMSTTATITETLIESFLVWCLAVKGYAPQTLCTYRSGILSYCKFLTRRQLVPPSFRVDRLKLNLRDVTPSWSYQRPDVDHGGAVRAVLAVSVADRPVPQRADRTTYAYRGPRSRRGRLLLLRDRALMRTLYCTGMRRQEVLQLNREDISPGHRATVRIVGKGNRRRLVFLDIATTAAISAYLAARDDDYRPLLIRHDSARKGPGPDGEGYRIQGQTVWLITSKWGRSIGVHLNPHALRHVKATVTLNLGADLGLVQDIMGHSTPDVTKRVYAQLTEKRLREGFHTYNASPEEALALLEDDDEEEDDDDDDSPHAS
jgi:site-specific recombinase XerD